MTRLILRCLSVACLALALCAPCPSYAQVYKWTDEKGDIHFGDSPYAMKDAQGKGSLVIPAKKAAKEPEPAAEEPEVQPAPETAQEKPADDQAKPVKAVGDPDVATRPAQKKETAKTPDQQQQAPAEKVKMRKRVLRAQKLEKEKSGSGQTTSPAEATAP